MGSGELSETKLDDLTKLAFPAQLAAWSLFYFDNPNLCIKSVNVHSIKYMSNQKELLCITISHVPAPSSAFPSHFLTGEENEHSLLPVLNQLPLRADNTHHSCCRANKY